MQNIFFTSLLLIFISCSIKEVENKENLCTTSNSYAKNFKIYYKNQKPIIEVYNYYQGARNEKITYDLNKINITIPVKKIILLSSTYIGFIEKLEELSSIAGISGLKTIYNKKIKELVKNGKIQEIGYEQNLLYETILNIKPDIVFAYSVGKENLPYIKKIESLGIPVIFTAEYLENHPLGRSEWIKFFSVFFNKEKQADSIFKDIEKKYLNVKNKISNSSKPLILLNYPYNGVWYLPNNHSYFVQLIRDAGGHYIFDSLTEKTIYPMNEEWVIYYAKEVDVWINIGQIISKKEINFDAFKNIKAFKEGRLYNHNLKIDHQGANEFWEKSIVEPYYILEDLWNIFHNPDSNFTYHYYKKL